MPWDFSLVFTGDVITEGLPAPVVVLAVAILFWLLLKNTRIGTGIYAIGSDAGSAEANGVDVRRTRFFTFTFAGMCYARRRAFHHRQHGRRRPADRRQDAAADLRRRGTGRHADRRRPGRRRRHDLRRVDAHRRGQHLPRARRAHLLHADRRGRDPAHRRPRFFARPSLAGGRDHALLAGDAAGAAGVLPPLQIASRGRANPPRRARPACGRRRHRRCSLARPAPHGAALRRACLPHLHRHSGCHPRHLRRRLLAARLSQRDADPDRLPGDSRSRPGHGHHHRRARSLGAVDHDLPGDRRHHSLQRGRRAGGVGDSGGTRDRHRHRLPQRHDHRPLRALADHRYARDERHPGRRVAAVQARARPSARRRRRSPGS